MPRDYFDLIKGNPDIFPGFFHIDLKKNVLPKLRLLQQFGFYPAPVLDVTAVRNAYGTQVDSFTATVDADADPALAGLREAA